MPKLFIWDAPYSNPYGFRSIGNGNTSNPMPRRHKIHFSNPPRSIVGVRPGLAVSSHVEGYEPWNVWEPVEAPARGQDLAAWASKPTSEDPKPWFEFTYQSDCKVNFLILCPGIGGGISSRSFPAEISIEYSAINGIGGKLGPLAVDDEPRARFVVYMLPKTVTANRFRIIAEECRANESGQKCFELAWARLGLKSVEVTQKARDSVDFVLSTDPSTILVVGDEPSGFDYNDGDKTWGPAPGLLPENYAEGYHDVAAYALAKNSHARLSPGGFFDTAYAEGFLKAYTDLYGCAPPVHEWNFHCGIDLANPRGVDNWKRAVSGFSQWSAAHARKMSLGQIQFTGGTIEQAAQVLPDVLQTVDQDSNIVSVNLWRYNKYPNEPPPYHIVDDQDKLTPLGLAAYEYIKQERAQMQNDALLARWWVRFGYNSNNNDVQVFGIVNVNRIRRLDDGTFNVYFYPVPAMRYTYIVHGWDCNVCKIIEESDEPTGTGEMFVRIAAYDQNGAIMNPRNISLIAYGES